LSITSATEATITLAATGDGSTYTVSADATVTALWAVGDYTWAFTATLGDNTYLIQTGALTIAALTTVPQTDLASAETALADVRAALALASGQSVSYSIKDRSLTRRTVSELISLESYWQRRVNDLTATQDSACDSKTGNRRITYATFK